MIKSIIKQLSTYQILSIMHVSITIFFHGFSNLTSHFSLPRRKSVFDHGWNAAFDVHVSNIGNSSAILVNFFNYVSSQIHLSSNYLIHLRIWIFTSSCTNIYLRIAYSQLSWYTHEISLSYWPDCFIPHIIDPEFILHFIQHLNLNQHWINFKKSLLLL